ncbi:hypothetical protein GWI33_018508 [Rhynchophorus ferrugineus]|uniref:Uncharacterized protein n=1 Tax=Rhynchophorus ferrugineus TaxID=354439 RepID=A0A834HVX1_RHYFE|nr:hypothetical protein GWI33_018508 [Rhynchophorus ferrugineus]
MENAWSPPRSRPEGRRLAVDSPITKPRHASASNEREQMRNRDGGGGRGGYGGALLRYDRPPLHAEPRPPVCRPHARPSGLNSQLYDQNRAINSFADIVPAIFKCNDTHTTVHSVSLVYIFSRFCRLRSPSFPGRFSVALAAPISIRYDDGDSDDDITTTG